mgnify:FL=1
MTPFDWERAAGLLLHFLWPLSCPVCGKLGSPLCRECLQGIVGTEPGRISCSECLGPYPCPGHYDAFPVRSLTSFGGLSRELVHRLKYGSRKCLGKPIGDIMGRRFQPPGRVILVPVPLHQGSKRDFNQSREIALGISRAWGCVVADKLAWKSRRATQVGLPPGLRKKLPPGSMAWKGAIDRGLPVVLVDDVCTTGATLRVAAGAVRAAGGKVEGALVWALAGSRLTGAGGLH